jgi:phosphatidylglycerol:prolipoprotein diacylglycerol transferase
VHPIAFHLGSYGVHWYGVMMALAFLAGLWTAARRGVYSGLTPDKVYDIGIWLMIGTIVGARTVHVITYWDELMKDPLFPSAPWTEIFMVQRGGLVFYGGLVGASLACVLYARRRKIPLFKLADVLAPSIALGYVFGRLGCFLNGCCYGQVCHLPWAVRFPYESDAWRGQVARELITRLDLKSLPVHPTQLYESFLSLGLYLGLAWLYRRKKFDGQVFAAYLICYAVTRSIVETFRGDYTPSHVHGGLTPAQWLSVLIFATGIAFYWALPKRIGPTPPEAKMENRG